MFCKNENGIFIFLLIKTVGNVVVGYLHIENLFHSLFIDLDQA